MKAKYCKKIFQSYRDGLEAQINCDEIRRCFAIYDDQCDASNDFSLCYEDDVGERHYQLDHHCIFQKGEN